MASVVDMEGMTAGNFIREIVESDLKSGKHRRIVTRFPPEPNGYLHIGHAKSICLNFGLALEHGGVCHLRFDDTNPSTENVEYAEAIQADVRWLGFDWGDRMFYASGYFGQLYEYAVELITKGKAYVDSLSAEEIRQYRGTLTEPGKNSPYRNRSVEESRDLFARMRAGEFKDGAHVLRAKIDMASPNVNMRDPTMYRIRHVAHYRTGDRWCIYPTYDYAHPISDAIEGISHSICTLEFEDHRPLYDWFLDNVSVPCHPQQIEFARLNLPHGHEQAAAPGTGRQGARERLGRFAPADPQGLAAAGLHAGGDPRLLRAHRRAEARRDGRDGPARALHPGGPQQALATRDGGAAAPASGPRELPGRPRGGGGRRQQPGGSRHGEAEGALLPRAVHRAGRLSRSAAEEVLPPRARPGSPPPLCLHHQVRGSRERRAHRRGGRAALHLRSGDADGRAAGRPQGEGHDPLGVGCPRAGRGGPVVRSPPRQGRRARHPRGA